MASAMPLTTYGAEEQQAVLSEKIHSYNGKYGDNITWTLDADGTLTLSGEGEIPDRNGRTPWFDQSFNINNVIVEDGITSIGKSAFIELNFVTSVSLPEGLKSIGDDAFCQCINLQTINIPDSVESIGENAFVGCHFTELELPDNISYIGTRAFFSSSIKKLKLPDKLTVIDVGTFSTCSLDEVTISDNVKYINDLAFNANNIKSVIIPESVEKVHYRAFSYCDDLAEVIFKNPDTRIVDDDNKECNNLYYKFGAKGDEDYKGIFKGYKGSNAEKYAETAQIEFVALLSEKSGDSNGDGQVSMADAVLIMQYISNPDKYGENGTDKNHITEQGKKNSDIAGENDGVTNADALAIQKKLLKLD